MAKNGKKWRFLAFFFWRHIGKKRKKRVFLVFSWNRMFSANSVFDKKPTFMFGFCHFGGLDHDFRGPKVLKKGSFLSTFWTPFLANIWVHSARNGSKRVSKNDPKMSHFGVIFDPKITPFWPLFYGITP